MDNGYKATRVLLEHCKDRQAPASLGDAVMRRVRAIEERRMKKRIIWALVLRAACIGLFVFLVGGTLVSAWGGFGRTDWWRVAEIAEAAALLVLGIKVFRILV